MKHIASLSFLLMMTMSGFAATDTNTDVKDILASLKTQPPATDDVPTAKSIPVDRANKVNYKQVCFDISFNPKLDSEGMETLAFVDDNYNNYETRLIKYTIDKNEYATSVSEKRTICFKNPEADAELPYYGNSSNGGYDIYTEAKDIHSTRIRLHPYAPSVYEDPDEVSMLNYKINDDKSVWITLKDNFPNKGRVKISIYSANLQSVTNVGQLEGSYQLVSEDVFNGGGSYNMKAVNSLDGIVNVYSLKIVTERDGETKTTTKMLSITPEDMNGSGYKTACFTTIDFLKEMGKTESTTIRFYKIGSSESIDRTVKYQIDAFKPKKNEYAFTSVKICFSDPDGDATVEYPKSDYKPMTQHTDNGFSQEINVHLYSTRPAEPVEDSNSPSYTN